MSNEPPLPAPPTVGWTSLSGRLNIHFLQRVLMQIRMDVQHAAEPRDAKTPGYAALLLGRASADQFRIESWRPLPFALDQLSGLGPAASLSIPASLLQDDLESGAKVIGWLVLHTRTGPDLDSAEMRLNNRLFPNDEALLVVMSLHGEEAELRFHRCGEAVEAFDPPLRIDARGAVLLASQPKPARSEEEESGAPRLQPRSSRPAAVLASLVLLFPAAMVATGWFCWPALEQELASRRGTAPQRDPSGPGEYLQLSATDEPAGPMIHWNPSSLPIQRAAQEPDGFQAELIEDDQAVANATSLTLAQLQDGELPLASAQRYSVTMRVQIKSSREQWSESLAWTRSVQRAPTPAESLKERRRPASRMTEKRASSTVAKKARTVRTPKAKGRRGTARERRRRRRLARRCTRTANRQGLALLL